MLKIDLPPEVMTVLREFRVCEFTPLSRDRTPTTWPTAARYEPEKGRFLITTSIGFPQKVYNIRRAAQTYLEKRHLQRPKVHWDEIKTLRAEARKDGQK